MQCERPFTYIEDWNVRTFRPKWFGLFGEPQPIKYRTPPGPKAHQISVVSLDKHDFELQLWVDEEYMGSRDIASNSTADCGDDSDVVKCLTFGSAFFVPPGRHTVRAEIMKREYGSIISFQSSNAMAGNASETFVWGNERQRRVMWLIQRCA